MSRTKKCVPLLFYISLFLVLLSLSLLALATFDGAFAARVDGALGQPLRRTLGALGSVSGISFAECIVVSLPVLLVLLLVIAFNLRGVRRKIRLLLYTLSAVFLVLSFYVISMGIAYHTPTVDEKMELEVSTPTPEKIYEMSLYLTEKINKEAESVDFSLGYSTMPYDLDELSRRVVLSYDKFLMDYDITENFDSRIKPVMLSDLMASAGILGMYTFFTGESNVSTSYPDYCIPSTVIHEFAHQRGIMRENEANFVAFAVAEYSTDPYIRYSGYVGMLESLLSALNKTDPELVSEIYSALHPGVLRDFERYRELRLLHKNTALRNFATSVNDTYLKLNGTDGVVTYSRSVSLALAYFEKTK